MKVVIIGNGIAGTTAARTLRDQDSELEIEIYTCEEHHHYPRPQLIEFLADRIPKERIFLHDERWYRDRRIEVHLKTPVAGLELEHGRIALEGGARVAYDKLLLATGARPFVPELPGVTNEGVFTLRTIKDALTLKERAHKAKGMIVIGGGLLGLEAAQALCTSTGIHAYVLERRGWPLSRQLDRRGGELLMQRLREMGVEIVTEAQSAQILGDGRVRGVELADGRMIDGDLVLIATGIKPNDELAREAGLEVNRGIVVDEHLQSSAPGVYAAGDVAEFNGRVYGIIPAALEQARVAALNILEQGAEYQGTVPSNTLHVAGIELFSAGEVDPPPGTGCEEIREQNEERGIYKKLVFRGGKLVGAILLGTKRNALHFARLIAESRDLSGYRRELLADDFDFKSLQI